jgi:hypothetical protein
MVMTVNQYLMASLSNCLYIDMATKVSIRTTIQQLIFIPVEGQIHCWHVLVGRIVFYHYSLVDVYRNIILFEVVYFYLNHVLRYFYCSMCLTWIHEVYCLFQSNIGLILHAVEEYDLSLRFLEHALKVNTK